MIRRLIAVGCIFTCVACFTLKLSAQDNTEYKPNVAQASEEGAKAIKRIRAPQGFQVDLFAAEPLLANPVAFCIDGQGRFYVAETFRHFAGVTDARRHMYWLNDDLASRTVQDRVEMYRKHLKDKFDTYAVEHDRIKLVEDRDGDGKADQATVFADGFKTHATGIGAGVLARDGKVWYTCIPDLWQLEDKNGDGKADERKSLHTGYGVHVGFLGHDLHGLILGPDGRLYFSIGDRGLNVETEGKRLFYPDTGCVLRCNPDGSGLEVFASGLRNPQELAFDAYGNLFTCDNNSDSGDRARWVHLVEGGDSGWRIGYQFHEVPTSRGPWNGEKLWDAEKQWDPKFEGYAAYLVPPLANLSDGPSGLCAYPGVGFPDSFKGQFFLCDFRGDYGRSGVRAVSVEPRGATFRVQKQEEFAWLVLATDVDFGPDGCMYISDWVQGWDKPTKGRIYKVSHPEAHAKPEVADAKQLLAGGLAKLPAAEVAQRLGHADQRVRLEAQLALVRLGQAGLPLLQTAAMKGERLEARLHGLWGWGQLGRAKPDSLNAAVALLNDPLPEVRAQAAQVLGDARCAAAYEGLVAKLKDDSPSVQFQAALGLSKLGNKAAVEPIVEMLRTNDERDPYLRHAGVMALWRLNDEAALQKAASDASPAVRLAALLAYRRLESAQVAGFLNDVSPQVVLEAARAINDVPIPAAFPQLAALTSQTGLSDLVARRALNAAFRLGQPENALALAQFAASPQAKETVRVEALKLLGQWAQPSGRDHVLGLWRPLAARPAEPAAAAFRQHLGGIFAGSPKVREEAAKLAGQLGVPEVGPVLFAQLSGDTPPEVRVAALAALDTLKDAKLADAMRLALADQDASVRTQGRRVLAKLNPDEALKSLRQALESKELLEQQGALSTLADMNSPPADDFLVTWLDRLLAGQAPPEIHLDLLDAAGRRPMKAIQQRLAQFEQSRNPQDPLAKYRESLAGGNAERGRKIFLERATVSCHRCHKLQGVGSDVGPDLSDVGKRQKRDYLLESLVDPSRTIAKGFDTVIVETSSGLVHVGILKEEDDKQLKLLTAEGKLVVVPKSEIEDRSRGKSAMPESIRDNLTKFDLRDLVEFLSQLQTPPSNPPKP